MSYVGALESIEKHIQRCPYVPLHVHAYMHMCTQTNASFLARNMHLLLHFRISENLTLIPLWVCTCSGCGLIASTSIHVYIRTLWNVHDCYRNSCYDVIYDKRRSITEYPLEDWDVNEEEFEPRPSRKGRGQGTADRLRREDGLESFPQW